MEDILVVEQKRASVIELWKSGKTQAEILTFIVSEDTRSFKSRTIKRYSTHGCIKDLPHNNTS